ncbi:MAG: apolipoprotein N-acyltransferase [Rhodospirillales bacterium]
MPPAGRTPAEKNAHAQPAPGAGVARLKGRLVRLTGWRRAVTAVGLGALAAAALPPLHLLPLLIPAFAGLLWMIEESDTPARAFSGGWWFGIGFWAAGLYWIGFAFMVDAQRYGWLAPFAVTGMAAGMALFPGAAAALSRLSFVTAGIGAVGRVIVFGGLWTVVEWGRGWVFTGFPWNLVGTAWTVSDAMIQLVAVTGVYGLSLMTVVAAAMPAVLAEPPIAGGHRRWAPVIGAFTVLGLIWVGGQARLAAATGDTVPGVRLRLVQPNIPQALKWRRELRRGHVLRQLEMSRAPVASDIGPTHVIWAETAVPFVLDRAPGLTETIARAAPPGGLVIVGAPRTSPAGSTPARAWNSLHAIDAEGRVEGVYDKSHLVPFGEYVPFRGILPLGKLTEGRLDFSPGPGVRTLRLKGLPPVSPLICFEAIFPGRVVDPGDRPQWLLNLTNDAWFGQSSGPYQHFAAARLRAVEEGMPLVRVANTGISGIVDAYGRVVRRLGLGEAGVIDGPLPAFLRTPPPFARFGDWMTGLIIVMVLGPGFLLTRMTRSRSRQ